MPSEKDNFVLKPTDYKISDNDIRAFYDKHGKLVFILDFAISELKPNVLLVMASHGDRKWDDVLANDYGMDLELIRPKKDNKYQKLDIEYDGLGVYDNLIQAYKDGGNVKSALKDLERFRAMSVRRSATERLAASTAIAENARETIERTNDTIVELQAKIKAVRSKLTGFRRAVGKEPTKQSAAKILKAEAQLDVLTGKLTRAKKRLENANKRLLVAEDDMAAARKVLDLVPDTGDDVNVKSVNTASKIVPVVADDATTDDGDDSEEYETSDDDIIEDEQYSDTENESVKPLFDKDPNILDDKIAFKPISFDEKIAQDVIEEAPLEPEELLQEKTDTQSVDDAQSALSFAPPKAIMDVVQVPQNDNTDDEVRFDDVFSEVADSQVEYDTDVNTSEPAPVLDSLQSVDEENTAVVLEKDNKMTEIVAPENSESSLDDTVDIQDGQLGADKALDNISENSRETVVRPVSPVRPPHIIMENAPKPETHQHRPSLLYYVLLLVLIALSVFTLWLYQRSNVSGDSVPELVAEVAPVMTPKSESVTISTNVEPVAAHVEEESNPFVASAGDDKEADSGDAPVVGKVMENSLNKIAKVADEQSMDENSDVKDDAVESGEDASESVVTAVNKPEYKVTQENVFTTNEPDNVTNGPVCDDGLAPDANGCCVGETYTDMGDQGFNCCPNNGGDCFPPLEW